MLQGCGEERGPESTCHTRRSSRSCLHFRKGSLRLQARTGLQAPAGPQGDAGHGPLLGALTLLCRFHRRPRPSRTEGRRPRGQADHPAD